MRALFTAVLLTIISGSLPGFAETVHDRRTWINITGQGRIGRSPWRWYFDVQERNRNSSADADQFVVRPAIGYALNKSSTVWVGYAYTANFTEPEAILSENRTWQQYSWSGFAGRGTLSARTRVEQRFFEGAHSAGWRARQQVRLLYPLWKHESIAPIVWDEVLVHLNSTSRTQRGFDQNRAFAGIGINASPRARLEIGYMNQFAHGTSRNRMNHILSGVVSLSF